MKTSPAKTKNGGGVLRSMTGFGRSEAGATTTCVAEVKAVNGRFLDVRVRLPSALAAAEPRVQEWVRATVQRGSVDVSVRFRTTASATATSTVVDFAAAKELAKRCSELSDTLGAPIVPTVDFLWASGRVFLNREEDADPSQMNAMETAVKEALQAMIRARTEEGARLKAALDSEIGRIETLVTTLTTLAAEQPARAKERLEERLARYGSELREKADPQRLELELALFADRSDVSEELVRLGAHLHAYREQLAAGDAIGRRLEFLTQELHREANTLGTKAATAELSSAVVELKASIERLREQVQNVE